MSNIYIETVINELKKADKQKHVDIREVMEISDRPCAKNYVRLSRGAMDLYIAKLITQKKFKIITRRITEDTGFKMVNYDSKADKKTIFNGRTTYIIQGDSIEHVNTEI